VWILASSISVKEQQHSETVPFRPIMVDKEGGLESLGVEMVGMGLVVSKGKGSSIDGSKME